MPTKAQNRATAKYKKNNYHRIPVEVKKDFYEEIKAAAEAEGETVGAYVKRAIRERMDARNAEAAEDRIPETSAEGTQDAAEGKKEAQPMKL